VLPKGHTELVDRLRRLACLVTGRLDLEMVELSVSGSSKRRLIRVDIDRAGPTGVNVEDCRTMSFALDQELEQEGLLPGDFVLEVSSPGLDRPIRSADDVRRNIGRRVRIETLEPVNGSREWIGILLDGDEKRIRIQEPSGEAIEIDASNITKAQQDLEF
jgi:ribosome maturation factor RimP